MNTIFQEYTPGTPASITLTTPAGKSVKLVYQEKSGPGCFHSKNTGLFTTTADFEIENHIATIAHVHNINEPHKLTGYFELEIIFGTGDDATVINASHLTLAQICEIIDRDNYDFCLELCTCRGPHNRTYWPNK